MSRLQPSRAFERDGEAPDAETLDGRARLTIGLVNNMPDAALVATERQFGDLLRAARPDLDIQLRLYSFRSVERGERAVQHMAGHYADVQAVPGAGLDGVVVTGAEPKAADLAEEPFWPELARLIDWTDRSGVPAIWSCLAAHAAVLHQTGVRRRPLAAKCSGVFECERADDHAALNGAPVRLFTPHSRHNELAEGDLAAAGYQILTRSPAAGVDALVRPGGAPALYFQGHPEYDADTLAREYLRDVGRFLRGERPVHPPMPHGYFDQRTQRILANMTRCGEQAPRPELIADYAGIVETAAPAQVWRATGLGLVGGWLGSVLERSNAGASPPARAWTSRRTPGALAG